MKQWKLVLFKGASAVTTVFAPGRRCVDAVREHWPEARLHSVDHKAGLTFWVTNQGLVSCEFLSDLPGS